MLFDEASQRHRPLLGHGNVVSARVDSNHGILTSVDQSLTPALLHNSVQTSQVVEGRRAELGFVTPFERVHRCIESGIRHGKLQPLSSIRLPQTPSPISLLALGKHPIHLHRRRNKQTHRTALAEPTDGVNAAGLADRLCRSGHALVEEAVLARGLVLAPPRPGVGLVVVVARLGGGLVAGDVGGLEAVGGRGVDEDWEEGDGVEDLDEEFLEGAGFGAEEGAGLCVACGELVRCLVNDKLRRR